MSGVMREVTILEAKVADISYEIRVPQVGTPNLVVESLGVRLLLDTVTELARRRIALACGNVTSLPGTNVPSRADRIICWEELDTIQREGWEAYAQHMAEVAEAAEVERQRRRR